MVALGELTRHLRGKDDLEPVTHELAVALADASLGVPLALIYVLDVEDGYLHLAEELGALAHDFQAPLVLPLHSDHQGSPFEVAVRAAVREAGEAEVELPGYRLLASGAGGNAGEPAELAIVVGGRSGTVDDEDALWSFARAVSRVAAAALDEQHLREDQRTIGQLRREAETNEHLYKNAAQAASKSRDEFLMTLSHELRTPLQAILGWSHLLATRKLEGELFWHAVRSIERNTRWQAQLIEDLLDMSQAITGRLRLNLQSTELDPVIAAAVDAVRAAAELKGVDMHVDLMHGPALWCDPDRLQQVVWNLLANAVKFTPRGGQVAVRARYSPGIARLEVQDNGDGIAAELLPTIFNRFSQAEGVETRTHSGVGLGLAIVRHIVELHGGTIEAHSAGVKQGALFVVELPLSPEDRHRIQAQQRHADEQRNGAPA